MLVSRLALLLAVVSAGASAMAAERSDAPTAAEKRHIQELLAPDGVRSAKARRANPVIDGAIVCRDLATVDLLTDQLTNAATDRMASVLTQGKSERAQRAAPVPNMAEFGCSFLPAGTPVTVEETDPVPVIRGEALLGVTVHGVTHPAMIEFDRAPAR
jgi:hypothetical protein